LHTETAHDPEVEEQKLGDLAHEYFGGEVDLEVDDSGDYAEIIIPANLENNEASADETADWITKHLDRIEEAYARINGIAQREPEDELADMIREETGGFLINR
jgi:ribosome assembly protein YihI (activator of Der GTPase)